MDIIEKLISHIPELLLNVVPGFISIRIKEIYGLKKKHNELGYALYCILYSFIILLIYRIIAVIAGAIWAPLGEILNKETVKSCGCLALAVVLGIILAKAPQSKPGKWFGKKINFLTSPEETVWEKAMKNPNGAHARVYLNNGMVYYGVLKNYTTDPDDPCKEVLLHDYSVTILRDAKEASDENDLIIPLKKETLMKDKVLIKRDEIISIEIIPASGNPTPDKKQINSQKPSGMHEPG